MAIHTKLSLDEAEHLLTYLINTERERLEILLAPYYSALSEAGLYRPTPSYGLPDGSRISYHGPTAEDIAGPYKAPRWLEQLSLSQPGINYQLRRFRRTMGRDQDEDQDNGDST